MEEILNPKFWQDALNNWAIPFGINLIIATLIFFGGRIIARFIVKAMGKLLIRANVDESLVKFFSDLAYALLLAVIVIAALERLGVQTTAAIAVIGAAGLAVGLALQGSLGNFASGVMIIIFKPYKVGDLVVLAGHEGHVEGIQIFNTVIVTLDHRKIIIPNGTITGSVIENKSNLGKIRVDMVFGIGYSDDIDKAKEVMLEILQKDERVLDDPGPVVAMCELGDSSVNFVARPHVRPEHYWDVMFDVTEQVKKQFDAHGISIPFPQRDVHLHQVNGQPNGDVKAA